MFTRAVESSKRLFTSHSLQVRNLNLLFLGAPGVGKGTYASRLKGVLGIPHISTGDMIRDEIRAGTLLGHRIKTLAEAGELVDDDTVVGLAKNRLTKDDVKGGFILDGFPRTVGQAKALKDFAKIDLCVNLTLRQDILVTKIGARRSCEDCGRSYNIAHIKEEGIDMPPLLPDCPEGKCDDCGGHLVQRSDDREEVVKRRLDVYDNETAPLVDFYTQEGILRDFHVVGGVEELMPKFVEFIHTEKNAIDNSV